MPWPTIWVETGDGTSHRLTADPPDESTGSRRYYYPAETVPAFVTLTHRYVLPGTAVPTYSQVELRGRDAVAWQSGEASAAVRRNAELVGTAATAPAFVYQTPWISFSSPAVPLLQTAAPISLTDGSGFQDRLAAGLTELLTADGHTLDGTYNVRLLCRYALELATPSPNGDGTGAAIVELLPVFYVPLWGLSVDGTLTAFATTAAAQVTEWLGRENLTAGKADAYVLDLSLFASGDAQMVRPLVELSGLTIATN